MLTIELHTDVPQDESLPVLLYRLARLPCLALAAALHPGATLPVPPPSEFVFDVCRVLMYSYAGPAGVSPHPVPGTLIVTNFRVVFVVEGRLPSAEAEAGAGDDGGGSSDGGAVSDLDSTVAGADSEEDDGEEVLPASMSPLSSPLAPAPASPSLAPALADTGDAAPAVDAGLGGADTGDVDVDVVDDRVRVPEVPLAAFQMALGSIIGVLRADRAAASACGTLDSMTLSSFPADFTRGQPLLQLDCDFFKCPAFVLVADPSDAAPDVGASVYRLRVCL